MLAVYNNPTSVKAQVNLQVNRRNLDTNMARLSSGLRINDAADDAAGLGISQTMRAQVRSLAQAGRNANDGISLMQTAGGAMIQQASVLTRMKELATQAANGTYSTGDLANIDTEFQQLISEVDRIAQSTSFNGLNLLTNTQTVTFQVGDSNSSFDKIDTTLQDTQASALGLSTQSTSSQSSAQTALTAINTAISTLSKSQALIGASQNRLLVAFDNAAIRRQATVQAESRIRDVDVAEEASSMSRNQVLVQAGTSVLAQANGLPQAALSLLRG
jgi:flagellin